MTSKAQRKDRKYKDLSVKQKTKIADKTYREYLTFYLKHERMPEEEEVAVLHRKLFQSVLALAPLETFEDFKKLCQKRSAKYEERILLDISRGITVESLHKPKKTPEEKAAILKAKNEARRKRRKKKKLRESQAMVPEQDDTFFFIAGYTSGGAPYGVTWEQMDMDPYDEIEQEKAQMSRKLVAYFSASGVTGNVAKALAEAANAGLYED